MGKKECDDINDNHGVKIYGTVVVGAKGQIVIPAQIRKDLEINTGDCLVAVTKHGKAIGMVKQDDIEEFMKFMKDEIGDCKHNGKKK